MPSLAGRHPARHATLLHLTTGLAGYIHHRFGISTRRGAPNEICSIVAVSFARCSCCVFVPCCGKQCLGRLTSSAPQSRAYLRRLGGLRTIVGYLRERKIKKLYCCRRARNHGSSGGLCGLVKSSTSRADKSSLSKSDGKRSRVNFPTLRRIKWT